MMVEVRKFHRTDALKLKDYAAVSYLAEIVQPEHLAQAETLKYSYSVYAGDQILLCAGVHEYWNDRGELWAIFDANCKRHFVGLVGAIRRFMDVCPLRRLEAVVDHGFEPGHRLVRALGMKLECETMEAYRHNGINSSLYARVRWPQQQG